jgi:hypothetical protein
MQRNRDWTRREQNVNIGAFAYEVSGMVYRKGELSPAMLDRRFPHQVALSADTVQTCYFAIRETGSSLGMAPRHHTVRHGERTYVVYCFADPESAEHFRRLFDGELFDPADRGRGSEWFLWRKPP